MPPLIQNEEAAVRTNHDGFNFVLRTTIQPLREDYDNAQISKIVPDRLALESHVVTS